MAAAAKGAIKILGGVPAAPAKRSPAIDAGMRKLDRQLAAIRRDSARIAKRSAARSR